TSRAHAIRHTQDVALVRSVGFSGPINDFDSTPRSDSHTAKAPRLAPENASLVLRHSRHLGFPDETFRRHDLDHAITQDRLEGVVDDRRRDPFRVLDDPARDLDALPDISGPPVRVSKRRAVRAMQARSGVCAEMRRTLRNPAHLLMRNDPTGAPGDFPQAA